MKNLKLTLFFSILFLSFSGFSQTKTWTGAGDGKSYNDHNNWSNAILPSAVDTIIFNNVTVTVTNLPGMTTNLTGIKIINNSDVTFESASSPVNFIFSNMSVESGNVFKLSGPSIISIAFDEAIVGGTLNAGDIHHFNSFGFFNFIGTAKAITANALGFKESFQGFLTYSELFILEFNGTVLQNTGLGNYSDPFGVLIISNSGQVQQDENIVTTDLILESGELSINSYLLTINGDYIDAGGVLGGTTDSELTISGNSTDEMHIRFNSGAGKDSLNKLIIDRSNEIININSDLHIENSLDLSSGKLRIYNKLFYSESTSVNFDNTNYIITANSGSVNVTIPAVTETLFPVGTETYFAPVSINTSAATEYSVTVHDTVYSEGNFGIPLNRKNVNIRWGIFPSTNTSYDLTLSWEPAAQLSGFNLANSYISNYTGTEWNNPGNSAGSNSSGLNTQTINAISGAGIFGVFSGINTLPTASDNEIFLAINSNYVFNPAEFNFSDVVDDDTFAKIMINNIPGTGVLFLDYNHNNFVDNGETIQAGIQIYTSQIINQLLKFAPLADDLGSPYTTFTFSVSDGMNYSTDQYLMTVNVTDNVPPTAEDQIFTIPEHSPNGTTVGKITASDQNAGQTLSFYPTADGVVYSDAFSLADDGTITVNNSDLLDYSIHPVFHYSIDVCDNGQPILCTPIRITINLSKIIRNLIPANYISPNGDGHNDRWLVKGLENDTYEAYIFNNNGKLVFKSLDYHNEWDGTSRGTRLPPGVYYYLLKSPTAEFKGTITLVR